MTTATVSTRTEKVREAGQMLDDHVLELAEQMGRGKSEKLLRYLEFAAHFHAYSFGNLMLILFQRPGATRVAGLRQWNKLGRHVRAGEKGIMILAPMSVKPRARANGSTPKEVEDPEEPETGDAPGESRRITLFKPVYVFDVAQTDGTEPPKLIDATGDASGCLPPLHKAIRETEADATAFVVCRHFGIECDSADYLLLHDADPKLLLDCLETVRATAATIIDAILTAQGHGGEQEGR